MLTDALRGFLILLILVSLLVLPLAYWLSAERALQYCTQSIAAMGWLWLIVTPLITLATWAIRRHWRRRRLRAAPGDPRTVPLPVEP